MKHYEMMILLDPSIDEKDKKSYEPILEKFMGSFFKSITDIQVMGKKDLSYPINKQSQALYLLIKFSTDKYDAQPMQKQIKLLDKILRYLVVVV